MRLFKKPTLLVVLLASAYSSTACSEEYTIWAPNLPYYWSETLGDAIATAKLYPGSIFDTDCVARYHEYRSAARFGKIWLPKPIVANVSSNIKGQFLDKDLKNRLSAQRVTLKTDKGVPVQIFTIPVSSGSRNRFRLFDLPQSFGRIGVIETLYTNPDSSNCHVPLTASERARATEHLGLSGYKVDNVEVSNVYLSNRMLLPEVAKSIVEIGMMDSREPPSESIAIVDKNGRISKIQCFISDFNRRPKAMRSKIIESCFDILTTGSPRKPLLRRYFDDAN